MKQFLKFILIILVASLIHFALLAQVKRVDAVGITVSNMDQSVKFYEQILGFKKISDHEVFGSEFEQLEAVFGLRMRIVKMQLGNECIELTDYLTSGGRSIPENAKSNDLIFQHIAIVVSDMDKAYERLRKYKVMHVSTSPQTIPATNVAAAGVKAFYFHDPDMHNLELIYFPPGKGQSKWQTTRDKLFLGIDHTAIAVSNTDSSLIFYEKILGIARKGDSWNKGIEQSHLNDVEDASLHITGLRSAEGPGIEFLEYLAPGPGKPFPVDSKANDIWHWQTTLVVDNARELYHVLKSSDYKLISSGLVKLNNRSDAFIVRDRDGHAMLIKQEEM